MIERCETCRFYGIRRNGPVSTANLCRRYPHEKQKIPDDWCGEWQAALDPAPLAEGGGG